MEMSLSIPAPPPNLLHTVRPGTLYIVSMPIGHIEDITVRALRVLQAVSLIAVENVSVTRELLRHYAIDTPLVSYSSRVGEASETQLLALLREGKAVALVSDAGTPLIADPGLALARKALEEGIPLAAIPGAVAALSALVVSGLPAGRFAFDGFPPRARADRAAFFTSLKKEPRTLLLYETRTHLRDTLRSLRAALGPSRILLIARNLTKQTETLFYGSLEEACGHFSSPMPGEYTLIVAGAPI